MCGGRTFESDDILHQNTVLMEVHGLILPLMASLMMILGVQPYHKRDWMVLL